MAAVAVGRDGTAAVAEMAEPPRRGRRMALAAASGLALSASFPSLDLEPLAFVALVPLFVAVRGLPPRPAFFLGWLTGLGFFLATCYWVVYTIGNYTALPMPVAAGVLVLMCAVLACYLGAFAAGVSWMAARRLAWVWLAPALWVVLEWARGWFFIGFPWAILGTSQYRYLDLVQVAEVTGVYGISALIVFFNAVVAAVLQARGPAVRRLVLPLLVLTALIAGLPAAGRWRRAFLADTPPAGTLKVAVAQGNVDQARKWDPAFQGETLRRYRELTDAAAATRPDLVVWPETATPFFFQEPSELREQVIDAARENGVHLLFGTPGFQQDARGTLRERNRAYLLSPSGRELGRYDKMELVPFGEYVPYQKVLFFVSQVVEAVGAMEAGTEATVFALPRGRFGVLVCYEGIFPPVGRTMVESGADFLVNVTNDAWYGPTSAPAQHLAQGVFRAIENRVPIVRAANTGISALIAADGRIAWQGPLDEMLWHVGEIAWPGVRTVYTRVGDGFVWACVLLVVGATVWGLARRPDEG